MISFLIILVRYLLVFMKNVWGCLNTPYVTYRRLIYEKIHLKTTFFIWMLVVSYFLFAASLRAGTDNPYLLTLQLNILLGSAVSSFFIFLLVLFILGKKVGGKGNFVGLYILWIYTLLPTISWFFSTSIFYLILPPPRTFSIWGKMFSVFFITLSLAFLIWKIILYYLTLRFALKLDLVKISLVSVVFAPIVIIYAMIMYRLGIFRIPFI